jgi:hypothetical protein
MSPPRTTSPIFSPRPADPRSSESSSQEASGRGGVAGAHRDAGRNPKKRKNDWHRNLRLPRECSEALVTLLRPVAEPLMDNRRAPLIRDPPGLFVAAVDHSDGSSTSPCTLRVIEIFRRTRASTRRGRRRAWRVARHAIGSATAFG